MLFKEIESTIQLKLKRLFLASAKATVENCGNLCNKGTILSDVMRDKDVLFFWSLLSVYIINEEDSLEILLNYG